MYLTSHSTLSARSSKHQRGTYTSRTNTTSQQNRILFSRPQGTTQFLHQPRTTLPFHLNHIMKNHTTTTTLLLALFFFATLIALTSALPTPFRLSARASAVVNIDAVRALMPRRHGQPGHGNGNGNGTLPTFPVLRNGTFVGLAGRNITMLGKSLGSFRRRQVHHVGR